MTIQWVPGHAGIEGNELADQRAKEAASLKDTPRNIAFGSAKAVIRRTIREKLPIRDDVACSYRFFSQTREALVQDRDKQRLLAQLRSGQHKAFGDYHKRLNSDHNPLCHRCHLADDSVKHWLTVCHATLAMRDALFQRHDNGLEVLSSHPVECVALAEKSGVMSC